MPFLLFLVIFISLGILFEGFGEFPIVLPGGIAAFIAVLMNRKAPFSEKVDVFSKGAGHPNIILMVMIFILAGAFSEVAEKMGAADSTVNLGLSLLPPSLLLVGMFVICCFISLAMGSSLGTIGAVAAIAAGLAEQTTIPTALMLGATVGGAFFGDNLSFISDTTIAAARTQAVAMKDKFIMNFKIVLPAAILTAVILALFGIGQTETLSGDQSFDIIKVLPYIAVLVFALIGINVLLVLIGGIIFATIVGLAYQSLSFTELVGHIGTGIEGMSEIVLLSIIVGGMAEVIKFNGGIDYLLNLITRKVKSKKGAEFSVSALAGAYDIGTANNTISIIMAGPIAKTISDDYQIDHRRTASLLDIFSSTFQGLLPYGAQLLAAASVASVSPFAIVPYTIYPILAGIFGVLAIKFRFPKTHGT